MTDPDDAPSRADDLLAQLMRRRVTKITSALKAAKTGA